MGEYAGVTQYEDRVPQGVRFHVESMMNVWMDEGRRDDKIENLVKSLVLHAYASGRNDGFDVAKEAIEQAARSLSIEHLPGYSIPG